MGNAVIVAPLLFISGIFGSIANASVPGRIAAVFPIRHLAQQMVALFDPTVHGSGISGAHVAVLLAWGIGALLVAAQRFRWDPP